MTTQGAVNTGLFGRLFQPTHDFYTMLNEQASKTLEGVKALQDWVNDPAATDRCQTVRDLENEADTLKFDLQKKLVESFITPFDREDIHELSQRLDEIINRAKSIVREIEAFQTKPQKHPEISELVAILLDGTQHIAASIANLRGNLTEATNEAMLSRKAENRLTKAYRTAMRQLLETDDIKTILRVKEVYKAVLACGEAIDVVGEKVLNVIIKMS